MYEVISLSSVLFSYGDALGEVDAGALNEPDPIEECVLEDDDAPDFAELA